MSKLTITAKGDGHEMAARFSLALKIAAGIDAAFAANGFQPYADAKAIRLALEGELGDVWKIAAGGKVPSEATKQVVLAIYAGRELALGLAPLLKTG